MLIRLTGVELLALHSALNEVGNGLPDEDVPAELRARAVEIEALLERTSAIELPDELEGASVEMELEPDEAVLGATTLDAAVAAIEEWEFQTRTGVSPDEAVSAAARLREIAQ